MLIVFNGDRPHGAAVATDDAQWQGDEIKTGRRDPVQMGQTFHNPDVAAEQRLMHVGHLDNIVHIRHGRRFNTDQRNPTLNKPAGKFTGDARECVAIGVGAQAVTFSSSGS